MYLKLSNWMTHKKFEHTFPDKGMILIKGDSGVGKSSIIRAIKHALVGEERRIKSWYGGKGTVELHIDIHGTLLKITRTNNPAALTVISDDKTYSDDDAQRIINDSFGLKKNEISLGSYISQSSPESLLNMTPKNLYQILQSLSDKKGDNPKKYRDIAEKHISDLEKRVVEQDNKVKIHKVSVEYAEKNMITAECKPPSNIHVSYPNGITKKIIYQNEIVSQLENKIADIESQIKDGKHFDSDKIEQYIRALEASKNICSEEQNKYKIELDKILDIDDIQKQQNSLSNRITLINILRESESETKEMLALASSDKTELSEWVSSVTTEIEKTLGDFRLQYVKIQENINNLKNWENVMECPVCDTHLKILNEKLIKMEDKPESIDEMIASEEKVISDMTQKGSEYKNTLNAINQHWSKIQDLQKRFDEKSKDNLYPDLWDLHEIHNEIAIRNEKITSHRALLDGFKIQTENIKRTQIDLDIQKQKLQTESLSGLPTLKSLTKTLDELQGELVKEQKILLDVSKTHSEFCKYQVEVRTYEENKKKFEKFEYERDQALQCLKKAEGELKTTIKELSGAKVYLKEIKEAANSMLQGLTDEINSHSADYIDLFLNESGTVVQISPFKKLRNGEIKAEAGYVVYHKDKEGVSLSELSGGEQSRIILGFQSGLGNMFNIPISLLDEALSSVPNKVRMDCYEVLKEVSERRLIISVEHNAPEALFDEVISL